MTVRAGSGTSSIHPGSTPGASSRAPISTAPYSYATATVLRGLKAGCYEAATGENHGKPRICRVQPTARLGWCRPIPPIPAFFLPARISGKCTVASTAVKSGSVYPVNSGKYARFYGTPRPDSRINSRSTRGDTPKAKKNQAVSFLERQSLLLDWPVRPLAPQVQHSLHQSPL